MPASHTTARSFEEDIARLLRVRMNALAIEVGDKRGDCSMYIKYILYKTCANELLLMCALELKSASVHDFATCNCHTAPQKWLFRIQ